MAENRIPVLFDTDIGSDIDDAIALAYLLCQPRCELLGITTVTGEPQTRAQLADAVCRAFGRNDVPIHSGAGIPLLVPQLQPQAPQKSVLPKYPHNEHFAANTAVDFLRQTIRSRPGEITLLAVGPFTNVGLLFAMDPEIPKLLKKLVIMGGLYVSRPAGYGLKEWNTMGDPHATAIMFGANVPGTQCYGLDVTTQCRLQIDEARKRFGKGKLQILADMAEVWFKSRPHITFHDPLAAVGVFEPELCKYQSGLVEIELHSPRLIGFTDFRTDTKSKPHQVAVSVESEAFFKHYFDVIERGAQARSISHGSAIAATGAAAIGGSMNLNAKPEKMVDGCGFPEGPAFGPDGWLYYVNVEGGYVSKVSMAGENKRIVDSPRPNGGQFDAKGNYVVCECKKKSIIRIAADGSVATVVDNYKGQPFNGPNDIAIDADGGMYFTDPDGSDLNNRIGAVYYVRPDRTVTRVAEGLAYPNGINITADRSAVLIAETLTHQIHRYARKADGTFGQRETLCKIEGGVGPDGMCLDREGNLYVAWYGSACVYVISPQGKTIGKIGLDGDNPTNCCFGPPGTKWETSLFVTETQTNTIVRYEIGIPGMPLLGTRGM